MIPGTPTIARTTLSPLSNLNLGIFFFIEYQLDCRIIARRATRRRFGLLRREEYDIDERDVSTTNSLPVDGDRKSQL
jgi:hypothetical protein